MAGVQNEMLERAEGGIALARVGSFARAAHVQNQAGEGKIFGDIDDALQFVHGFDAAHAFDFADGEGAAAFAIDAEVAAGGRVEGSKLQVIIGEGLGDGLNFLPWWRNRSGCGWRRFRRLGSRRRRSGASSSGVNLLGNEQISGEDSCIVSEFILALQMPEEKAVVRCQRYSSGMTRAAMDRPWRQQV